MKFAHRLLAAAIAAGVPAVALAHTGHASGSLYAGLAHPLGADHLLAMLAVGLWSVVALPVGRRLIGPAVFMAGLLAGAAAALAGLALPAIETGVALSVALFGAMLAAPRALPQPVALAMLAIAAMLHGLSHGAELPAGAAFTGYAAGFVATTAVLHSAGLGLGRALQRMQRWAWQAAAGVLGTAGVALLALT